MSRTPSYYRAPLRSRDAIMSWLLRRMRENRRPSYGAFTFDVKIHSLDLSFNNLLTVAQAPAGDFVAADASSEYIAACREKYAERDIEDVYLWAIENMRDGVTKTDVYRMLWDGTHGIAEWAFDGRSGGWLVLTSFEDTPMTDADGETLASMPYAQLRRLYRFLIQCGHDFRPEALRKELEYQAAFLLFENICAEVPTDTQRNKEAAERAEWEARGTVTKETQ